MFVATPTFWWISKTLNRRPAPHSDPSTHAKRNEKEKKGDPTADNTTSNRPRSWSLRIARTWPSGWWRSSHPPKRNAKYDAEGAQPLVYPPLHGVLKESKERKRNPKRRKERKFRTIQRKLLGPSVCPKHVKYRSRMYHEGPINHSTTWCLCTYL